MSVNPISPLLNEKTAFWRQPNYEKVTRQELDSVKHVGSPVYVFNTEHKVWRVVKEIFLLIISIVIFPIGLYRLTHRLIGKLAVVPAATPRILGQSKDYAHELRRKYPIDATNEWKVKRITVVVDGYKIDAAIMGKASTLRTGGRWTLVSNGNGEFYEQKLFSFQPILSKIGGNAIVFNYPGVGTNTGLPNRSLIEKTYRAMLNFLEDRARGIGAEEVVGFGHSLGGGAQGEALRYHKLKSDIKYVFVKRQTFSDINSIMTHSANKYLAFGARFFGWNMSSVKSSRELKVPEIIMQTANVVENYSDIFEKPDCIIHDRVIPAEASLAKKLLDGYPFKGSKCFMGLYEGHNDRLWDATELVRIINIGMQLQTQK